MKLILKSPLTYAIWNLAWIALDVAWIVYSKRTTP